MSHELTCSNCGQVFLGRQPFGIVQVGGGFRNAPSYFVHVVQYPGVKAIPVKPGLP